MAECLLDAPGIAMRFRFLLTVAVVLVPWLAWGQTSGFTLSYDDDSLSRTVQINDGGGPNCDQQLTLKYAVQNLVTGCGQNIDFWVTTGGCNGDPPDGGTFASKALTDTNTIVPFVVGDALQSQPDICGSEAQHIYNICARYQQPQGFGSTGCSSVFPISFPTLVYDNKAPGAPAVIAVEGRDKALDVYVTPSGDKGPDGGSDTTLMVLAYGAALPDGGVPADLTRTDPQGVTTAALEIRGLENNTKYFVRAFARDAVGNESTASEAMEGTPVHTNGFYSFYRGAGGEEQGCSTAGGGILIGALPGIAWALFRRRRR